MPADPTCATVALVPCGRGARRRGALDVVEDVPPCASDGDDAAESFDDLTDPEIVVPCALELDDTALALLDTWRPRRRRRERARVALPTAHTVIGRRRAPRGRRLLGLLLAVAALVTGRWR